MKTKILIKTIIIIVITINFISINATSVVDYCQGDVGSCPGNAEMNIYNCKSTWCAGPRTDDQSTCMRCKWEKPIST